MPETRPAARQRLLSAADRLFYGEGVGCVGIDRVIAEAGVAKGSLYYVFGSKDELVRAYLSGRGQRWHGFVEAQLAARYPSAPERLTGVFELLGEGFALPEFNGCPFINASAEAPSQGTVRDATDSHRAWVKALFEDLAGQAGVAQPRPLALQLSLLYDGALVAARLDRDPQAAVPARLAAKALVAAALAPTC